jgi:CheY-like chemotaxis protein
MAKILILEQRPERISEFKRLLEPKYKLTFADSVKDAVTKSRTESYDLFVSALFLPRTETSTESVFDFARAAKAESRTKSVPFYFCCIRPSNMMQSMADALQSTATAIGAEYFELLKSEDLSNLPNQVAKAIAARKT